MWMLPNGFKNIEGLGSAGVRLGSVGVHWGLLGSVGVRWNPLYSVGGSFGVCWWSVWRLFEKVKVNLKLLICVTTIHFWSFFITSSTFIYKFKLVFIFRKSWRHNKIFWILYEKQYSVVLCLCLRRYKCGQNVHWRNWKSRRIQKESIGHWRSNYGGTGKFW